MRATNLLLTATVLTNLLLTSCSHQQLQPKRYKVVTTTTYCSGNAHYERLTGHCVLNQLPTNTIVRAEPVKSIKRTLKPKHPNYSTRHPSAKSAGDYSVARKVDCGYILEHINQCSI